MEKTREKAKLVVSIYDIPKRGRIRNRRLLKLPVVSAVDAVFDIWEGKVNKLYIPQGGVPGYDFDKFASKYNVKIETY
jgi:hypothetical protein